MTTPPTLRDVPMVYNLFPPLAGEVDRWLDHVERAAGMGFNWIFLNPIHLTGASGSLYAVRDYFRFNPRFFPADAFEAQKDRLARFVNDARARGADVMVDLVVNHTAYDNPLTRDHRDWYKQNADGSIRSPGAKDDQAPGGWVTWGDLSEIDNDHSHDRANLWEYWWKVVDMFLGCGVRGFRCDAAYQVPDALWKLLIERAKGKFPETRFFAESLGCPLEDTLTLGRRHDFVFNSGKWWDFREPWFLDQMRAMAGKARSIGFPESHDTRRLAEEYHNDRDLAMQRYLFAALASTGVLALMGFEYGFRKKPHVVETRADDYEGAQYDLTDFVRSVNRLKAAHRVFQEDNRMEAVDAGNDHVLALKKTTLDGQEKAVLLFNRTADRQEVDVAALLRRTGAPPLDASASPNAQRRTERAVLSRRGATVLKIF